MKKQEKIIPKPSFISKFFLNNHWNEKSKSKRNKDHNQDSNYDHHGWFLRGLLCTLFEFTLNLHELHQVIAGKSLLPLTVITDGP